MSEKNSDRKKYPTDRIFDVLRKIEDGVLVCLLLLMIGMATTQILLRNVFESGIYWGDTLIRILVLWIGLVGAMVAGRSGKHINIDVITRFLPKNLERLANGVVELFTAVICGVVTWYGTKFVLMEYENGGTAFAKVPPWICEAIIPFAFFVLAVRYLILSVKSLSEFAGREP